MKVNMSNMDSSSTVVNDNRGRAEELKRVLKRITLVFFCDRFCIDFRTDL